MKQFLTLILAGFIGGALAFYGFNTTTYKTQLLENQSPRAVLTSNSNAALQPFNFVEAAEKVTPAVVHITANESKTLAQQRSQERRGGQSPFDFFNFEDFFGQQFYGPKEGTGSGVIISEDGYIVTNNHVVGYADEIKVSLPDKREFIAKKIGTDPSTDIAVLKIEANGLNSVRFADSDEVKVGEWVAAIGNPFSYLTSTVTAGIVSAKGRDIDIIEGEKTIEEFIQTDAAINPGNSGGALVDEDGNLIGINTAIATPTGVFAGYSFAIPSNLVQRIVNEIKTNGDIRRAALGVYGASLDSELVKEKKLNISNGVYVDKLVPGSAAQMSGILPGDVITRVNNTSVNEWDDLVEVMRFAKVGDVLEVTVSRKKKIKTLKVQLRKGI